MLPYLAAFESKLQLTRGLFLGKNIQDLFFQCQRTKYRRYYKYHISENQEAVKWQLQRSRNSAEQKTSSISSDYSRNSAGSWASTGNKITSIMTTSIRKSKTI